MKKTKDNLEHRIQLKRDDIVRYEFRIINYPLERMIKYGMPHLYRLETELNNLILELENRDSTQ